MNSPNPNQIKSPSHDLTTLARPLAAAGGITYALGILIVNIHLGALGLSEFSLLRSYYVLAGVCFLVFVLSPGLAVFGPLVVVDLLQLRSLYLRLAIALTLFTVTVVFLLPGAFNHFIVPRPRSGLARQVLTFWRLYGELPIFGFLLLLYSPAVLQIRSPGNSRKRLRDLLPAPFSKAANYAAGVALIGLLVPYTYFAYPQILFSVGGGQPTIGSLLLPPSIARLFPKKSQFSGAEDDNPVLVGPLVIWHQSEAFFYVSYPQEQGHVDRVLSIPVDQVMGARTAEFQLLQEGNEIYLAGDEGAEITDEALLEFLLAPH